MKQSLYKFILLIYSIILMMVAMLYAIEPINNYSINTFSYYHDFYLSQGYPDGMAVMVMPEEYKYNYEDFLKDLDEIACNNNVLVSVFSVENDMGNDRYSLYTTSNDIMHRYLLTVGSNDEFGPTTFLSSHASNSSNKILTILSLTQLDFQSIINHETASQIYNLIDLDINDENNINQFNQELDHLNPGVRFNLTQTPYEGEFFSLINLYGGLFRHKIEKVAIVLSLTLIVTILSYSLYRSVGFYKNEGFSTLQIFNRLFAKSFIQFVLLIMLILYALLFICFRNNLYTFKVVVFALAMQQVQIIGLSILFSLLIYGVFYVIPILVSINGKNYLEPINITCLVFKLVILWLMIPLTLPFLSATKNYCIENYRKEIVLSTLNNLYMFGSRKNSTYFDELGYSNTNKIYQIFMDDYQAFEFNQSMLLKSDYSNVNDPDYAYIIDKGYIDHYGLIDSIDPSKVYVIDHNNQSINQELVNSYLVDYGYDLDNVEYIEINENLQNYALQELLLKDSLSQYPLIIYPTESSSQLSIQSLKFYSSLGYEATVNAIDQLFNHFGYQTPFRIESLQNRYLGYLTTFNTMYLTSIIPFIVLFISFIVIMIVLEMIDNVANSKKYYLRFVEGNQTLTLGAYMIKFSIPTVFAFAICLVNHQLTSFKAILISLFCYGLLEVIGYSVLNHVIIKRGNK